MAISRMRSQRKSNVGIDFGALGSNVSKAHTARETQNSDTVAKASFADVLTEESRGISAGERINILLPNGELDEHALERLQDKIHATGDLLIAKPGYDTVLEYRKNVQSFLKSILPYLQKKEHIEATFKMNGQDVRRKITLVHTANEKLDNMLKLVLNTQVNQTHIMQSLDEIRGLIINILQ